MEERLDSKPSDDSSEKEGKPSDWKTEAVDWAKALAVAAVLVVVIRFFLFSPFIVEGPSMYPNFFTGERIIVNKILYDIRAPKRGEVIVFHSPFNADYIKRVIALPGETVEVRGDTVLVNGEPIEEPYIQNEKDMNAEAGTTYNNKDYEKATVPEGHVFVMGDNRPNSQDSRDIGFIAYDKIVGRADVVIWPLPEIRFIPHTKPN
ncbi:signal peptidase I [Paenibacillus thermotolerans]|uniref:signal peptidase I n=1 Tax=Paenibacillus thermotolerans TaxID=3027807 RepID=UPI0023675598|nr:MULTISPECIES: signal peptidase I [unclassified Paenibacillus]